MSFTELLHNRYEKNQSLVCIGLDPRVTGSIDTSRNQENDIFLQITQQNKAIIDATIEHCACYKPNIAFYELWGEEGYRALKWTIEYVSDAVPIILDTKRGDIGATATAYAQSIFEHLKVHATTLAPYMGTESIVPFLAYDAMLFILARTSNPQADRIQKTIVTCSQGSAPVPLYLTVANIFQAYVQDTIHQAELGFVVGANCYEELAVMRKQYPKTWILAPGIGAQGADLSRTLQSGLGSNNRYLLAVVSRAIAQSDNPRETCVAYNNAIQTVLKHRTPLQVFTHDVAPAVDTKMQVETTSPSSTLMSVKQNKGEHEQSIQDDGVPTTSTPHMNHHTNKRQVPAHKISLTSLQQKIITALFENGCFSTGNFVLQSGVTSPFYIDLRRIISFPQLFEWVTEAYCMMIKPIDFDSIAALPTAALPLAAAVVRALNVPMIYPRIPRKQHGTGNLIEGDYQKHTRVLILDDLITQGTSKEEALAILSLENLIVQDIVVLICRSNNAIKDMNNMGITLHYALHIHDIISFSSEQGLLSSQDAQRIQEFLHQ